MSPLIRARPRRLRSALPSGKCHAGEFLKAINHLVLKGRVRCLGRGLLRLEVMPVAAADHGRGFCAASEPALRALPRVDVDRCARASHSRAHPARIDRVTEYFRPPPGEEESERHNMQLAFRIGATRIPGALGPIEVAQRAFSSTVKTAAKINQSVGALDQ